MSKEAFNSKYDLEKEDKLIEKINELYINFRQYFTVLTKQGKYLSSQAIKGNPKLNDNWIRNHLRGKQTIVVFSGKEMSKFLCFDVDVKDKSVAKWATYKIINRLISMGFNNEDIHVATSGNKGYHVLLFIEDGTSIANLKLIYDTVLKEEELLDFEYGQVEFRPSNTQGVKIELSHNFKNDKADNMCWFVKNDSLRRIKNQDYILKINPIPKEKFIDIMDRIKDEYTCVELDIKKEMSLMQTLNEPESHKVHKDENTTIDRAKDLLLNGLTISGSRHNSTLLLAKYFRYMGLELNECIAELSEWMKKQNTKYYSSSLEYALDEVGRLSTIVYEKGYNLTTKYENIKIYKSEMEAISTIRNKNLRLIMYAMMIHSKRYSLMNGVFYMSYKQIGEMVGMSCEKNILSNINKLEDSGLIEVVERNVIQKGTHKKKPNRYRVKFKVNTNEEFYELSYDESSVNLEYYHNESITNLVSIDVLKINLPKRQYLELRSLVV